MSKPLTGAPVLVVGAGIMGSGIAQVAAQAGHAVLLLDMREGAARQYPLGGVQTADQVADVMAWLLGDGAARLTGQVIAVDGGFTTVRPLVK